MSKRVYESENIAAAAAKMRELAGTETQYTTYDFVDGIEEVYKAGKAVSYDVGFEVGKQEGISEGIEQGKEIGAQAEYDKLWNGVQNYGNRTNYEYAFFGESWNDNTFYPKYDMILGEGWSATSMFRTSPIANLKQRLEECGVRLDTSKCQAFNTVFYSSQILVIPTIDMSNAEYGTDGCFVNCWSLTTIEKIIFSEKTLIEKMFTNCGELQEVIFEGVIAKNGLDLQWSTKLSKASWQSIIGVLSANTSGLSMTGSLASVNKAFETSEGANDGSTSTEWLNLIATKPNWTIKLV